MKKALLISLLVVGGLLSCKQKKTTIVEKVEEQGSVFTLIEGSRQRIYPGQQSAERTYTEHWVLVLEGPANQFAQLKLIVNSCEIILPDLSEKGVVFGTDTKKYVVEFDVPNTQSNSCLITSSEEAELLIDQGFRSEVILLRDLNNKEAVFLPSSMD